MLFSYCYHGAVKLCLMSFATLCTSQILMNVRDHHLVMKMLCVPTHLGPSLVPAMRDTVETE